LLLSVKKYDIQQQNIKNRCTFYCNILKCLKPCTTVYILTQNNRVGDHYEAKNVTVLLLVTSPRAQQFHSQQ